jgi:hypothetical protein
MQNAMCTVILSEAKNLSGKESGREILRRFRNNSILAFGSRAR